MTDERRKLLEQIAEIEAEISDWPEWKKQEGEHLKSIFKITPPSEVIADITHQMELAN